MNANTSPGVTASTIRGVMLRAASDVAGMVASSGIETVCHVLARIDLPRADIREAARNAQFNEYELGRLQHHLEARRRL